MYKYKYNNIKLYTKPVKLALTHATGLDVLLLLIVWLELEGV